MKQGRNESNIELIIIHDELSSIYAPDLAWTAVDLIAIRASDGDKINLITRR
jgi:hypothetical protein